MGDLLPDRSPDVVQEFQFSVAGSRPHQSPIHPWLWRGREHPRASQKSAILPGMNSYSQSGQDKFANFVNPKGGRFIDIGCAVPDWQSNVKGLMEIGWIGLAIDMGDYTQAWEPWKDKVKFERANAVEFDWNSFWPDQAPPVINYLSCDCDSATLLALDHLLEYGVYPVCATIEHDAYRFGDMLRAPINELMKDRNYILVKENISHNGMPYENWFCHKLVKNIDEIREWCNKL